MYIYLPLQYILLLAELYSQLYYKQAPSRYHTVCPILGSHQESLSALHNVYAPNIPHDNQQQLKFINNAFKSLKENKNRQQQN
jgi:hypothetical protein